MALSVAALPNYAFAPFAKRSPLALPGALPFVDGSCEFTTMESGLSSRPLRSREKRTGDHPAHPPCLIIRNAKAYAGLRLRGATMDRWICGTA